MPVYRPPEPVTSPPRRRYLPFLASLAIEFAIFIAVFALTIGAVRLIFGHVAKEATHVRAR